MWIAPAFIPLSQTHSVKWGTCLFSTHRPVYSKIVYPKIVYQSWSVSEIFLLLLLKFGKYLRVYRQKSHTFWHKKTELFKKKPQDNKPIQALNMINTRKFISKNMGRLSSNCFLSCFMARNYFYKNFLRRNKHLGFGYLCLYLKYFVFCYMNHIEHKNTLSVISPVCLSPSTCVVATPHTYIAPL